MKTLLMFSGGKDSTTLLLEGLKRGLEFTDIIFCDTGLEFPEMYQYIRRVEERIKRKITILQPRNSFLEWFFKPFIRGKYKGKIHGFPMVVSPCWHKRHAKARPVEKIEKEYDIVYIGLVKGEEHRGIKWKKNINYQYPLIEWGFSEKDCYNYCLDQDLFNPLYTIFNRLGCWLCPYQSLDSLEKLCRYYPFHFSLLKVLDNLSPHGFHKDKFRLMKAESRAQNMRLDSFSPFVMNCDSQQRTEEQKPLSHSSKKGSVRTKQAIKS